MRTSWGQTYFSIDKFQHKIINIRQRIQFAQAVLLDTEQMRSEKMLEPPSSWLQQGFLFIWRGRNSLVTVDTAFTGANEGIMQNTSKQYIKKKACYIALFVFLHFFPVRTPIISHLILYNTVILLTFSNDLYTIYRLYIWPNNVLFLTG